MVSLTIPPATSAFSSFTGSANLPYFDIVFSIKVNQKIDLNLHIIHSRALLA